MSEFEYSATKSFSELLTEWEDLINELSNKEIALFQWRECYNIKADEIIATTDFKGIYGANNAKIRDSHVKNELTSWHDTIKELEFSINYIERRLMFLRELIRTKRMIYEAQL